MSQCVKILAVLLFVALPALANDVTVEWANWDDNHLYDADGADLRAETDRFQLVFDMDGDTDVGAMVSNACWAIGAEADDTTLYGADDDVTVSTNNASWTVTQGWGSVDNRSLCDENLYGATRFYFRFFNAEQIPSATQAGLIYNTAGTWVTAAAAIDLEQAVSDLARTGSEASVLAGSTDGTHLDGWATMRSGPDDLDGDGLPDEWENRHFPGGTNATPEGHSDSDGLSDGDEYIAGTDPTNAASVFAVSIGRTNGAAVVWFTALEAAGPGYQRLARYYDLQSSASLTNASWRGVVGLTNILGRQHVVTHTPATSNTTLFRVKARLE